MLVTCMLVACKDKDDNAPDGNGNNTNGDDINNNDDTQGPPAGIISKFAESLKITCKRTYISPDFAYLNEEYNIYKVGNAFLTEEESSSGDGKNYHYYKKSPTTDYWAEYVLSYDEESWRYVASDHTANTLLDANGIAFLVDILNYVSNPTYGYKDEAEFMETEPIMISGFTYNCDKYEYVDTLYGGSLTFWVTTINDIEYCVKYTNDTYTVEVTAY